MQRTLRAKGPFEYFCRKVNIGLPSQCWEWQGSRYKRGYGQWFHAVPGMPKGGQAHRRAYFLFKGDIGDLHVCHKCGNPSCCNPDHLYLGTPKQNAQDRILHGTQQRGTNNKSKLTEDDVRNIRKRWAQGDTCASMAREYKVSEGAIRHIYKYRKWKWLG